MVGPIQLVKSVKHNLSVPIVITEEAKKDSEEAIQYERKVYRLVGINIGLFICLLALFKYLFQYRFGYSYWESLDYITDVLPFDEILMSMLGISIGTVIIFDKYVDVIENNASKPYKKTKRKLICVYWGEVLGFLLLASFVCSMFPTNILSYAAIIMIALVCIVKYLASYLYKKYNFKLTYYQSFIYMELISIVMVWLFKGSIVMMITDILCIFIDIVILIAAFQSVEHTKEKLNAGYDNRIEIDIVLYETSSHITFIITSLYAEISYLLFGGYAD